MVDFNNFWHATSRRNN